MNTSAAVCRINGASISQAEQAVAVATNIKAGPIVVSGGGHDGRSFGIGPSGEIGGQRGRRVLHRSDSKTGKVVSRLLSKSSYWGRHMKSLLLTSATLLVLGSRER